MQHRLTGLGDCFPVGGTEKRQKTKLEVAEVMTLSFCLGWIDGFRNEDFRDKMTSDALLEMN